MDGSSSNDLFSFPSTRVLYFWASIIKIATIARRSISGGSNSVVGDSESSNSITRGLRNGLGLHNENKVSVEQLD